MIETSTPARAPKGKEGEIDGISIDVAENGFSVRVNRKGKPSKAGDCPSYSSETSVFPSVGKMFSFLRKELKGIGAADDPADEADAE